MGSKYFHSCPGRVHHGWALSRGFPRSGAGPVPREFLRPATQCRGLPSHRPIFHPQHPDFPFRSFPALGEWTTKAGEASCPHLAACPVWLGSSHFLDIEAECWGLLESHNKEVAKARLESSFTNAKATLFYPLHPTHHCLFCYAHFCLPLCWPLCLPS